MTREELRNKWSCLKGVPIEHGAGWLPMLDGILTAMHKAGFDPERDKIAQIKEKFASLRVYVDYGMGLEGDTDRADNIENAIDLANTSTATCEICGKPGQIHVTNGWWSTCCAEHKKPTAQTLQEAFGNQKGQ